MSRRWRDPVAGWVLVAALAQLTEAPAAPLEEPPAAFEATLDRGHRELAAGSFVAAEESFRSVLADAPGSIPGHLGLARALAGRGRAEEALAGLLRHAERAIGSADYGPAARLLEAAVELAPGSPAALAGLGRVRALDRQYLAAESPLLEVYNAGAADLRTVLYLASTLWENGKAGQAEAVLRRAVERSDRALPAVYQLGRLLLWMSRFEEAAALLAECTTDPAAAPDVELDLARALAGTEDPEAAVAAYQGATARLPEHSEARYGLAMALMRAGDRAAAERELEIYDRLYREDQERIMRDGLMRARIDRGRDLLRQGRIAEAVEYLEGLPESADSLAALAAALRAQRQPGRAVEALVRAVALAPERQDIRALLNEARLEELELR